MSTTRIDIRSKSHDYHVLFLAGIAEAVAFHRGSASTFWLVDPNVEAAFPEAFAGVLDATNAVRVDATEENKSYEAIGPLFLEFLARGMRRDSTLVVVGGGILQDIGCFIASTFARGIKWELIPTTLLSQVDSCIGSKSSVNIGKYKNQLGTFYSPHRILLAEDATSTLGLKEIHSGIGELTKFLLLESEPDFERFVAEVHRHETERGWILPWTRRALEIKKAYIEEDEFDRGRRNLLNYGHTFGHAYESATRYELPHGIAVLLGMLTATSVSVSLGMANPVYLEKVQKGLRPWILPYWELLAKAPRQPIFDALKRDKKNTAKGINCILTCGFGKMERIALDLESVLVPELNRFIDNNPISEESAK